MADFCAENATGEPEDIGLLLLVRYPRGHHRHQGAQPCPFGDQRPLPPHLAELLAWSLRQQGAIVTLKAARPQLTLFPER